MTEPRDPREDETTTWTPPRADDLPESVPVPAAPEANARPATPAPAPGSAGAPSPPAATPPPPVDPVAGWPPSTPPPPGTGWTPPGGRGRDPRPRTRGGWDGERLLGIALLLFGVWLLLRRYIPLDADLLWPLAAIVVGGMLLAGGLRPRGRNG